MDNIPKQISEITRKSETSEITFHQLTQIIETDLSEPRRKTHPFHNTETKNKSTNNLTKILNIHDEQQEFKAGITCNDGAF